MARTIKAKSFSRLSAAQKRVAIAEDVIKQIRSGQYRIRAGQWLNFNEEQFNAPIKEVKIPTQQRLLGGPIVIQQQCKPVGCTCCAIGAAVASSIRLFNEFELDEDGVESFSHALKQLKKFFTEPQLRLIESAFEQRGQTNSETGKPEGWDLDDEMGGREFARAYGRYSKIYSDSERAHSIFQNIIKNNGTFKP